MPALPTSYVEARRLADAARARAVARREEIRQQVLDQVTRGKRRLGLTPVKVVVDRWASQDPVWKAAVADNQWYLAQATSYATCETVDVLRVIAEQQQMILKALKEISDDERATTEG